MPRPGTRAFRLEPDTTVFEPAPETPVEPSLFASSIEEPHRRSGVSVWFAAAAALVIGIGVGFASGYRAGKGSPPAAAAAPEHPATAGAAGGQPFSESSVQEPVNLNPPPIVPAPSTPAGPQRGSTPAAAPAPQMRKPAPAPAPQQGRTPAAAPAQTRKPAAAAATQQPAEGRPAKAPTAVGRVPPRTPAVAADPPEPAVTGPASMQVLSRPSGAQVILDGRPIGKTPMTVPDVSAGNHNIRLELAGFKGWATTVDVKAGSSSRVAASLEQ